MALGFVLRGRRGAYGTGLALVARLSALGRAWARLIAGDAKTLRGRCGTWRHPFSFRVAGVALGHIHLRFVWQAWHLWHWASFCVAGVALMALGWLKWRLGALGRTFSFRVAGVALGDIHLRSAWQAWHLVTSTLALGDMHFRFAWQVWHLVTFTFVLRGRRGTYGIVLAPGRHTPSFTHSIFVTHNFHTPPLSRTIFHTPSVSHTIFHTKLCHTPSFTVLVSCSSALVALAQAEIPCRHFSAEAQVQLAERDWCLCQACCPTEVDLLQ